MNLWTDRPTNRQTNEQTGRETDGPTILLQAVSQAVRQDSIRPFTFHRSKKKMKITAKKRECTKTCTSVDPDDD